MIIIRYLITILIVSVVLIMISNLINRENIQSKIINNKLPIYKSDYNDTMIYGREGTLNYHFIAQHVEHFSDEGISWFIQPLITKLDTNKVPSWSVKSDKAKLTRDLLLYLHGHVEVNSLNTGTQLHKIKTDNACINLVTQDMASYDPVTFCGNTFISRGSKMRGNLLNKKAELIEKVKTSYEIQKK